MIAELQRFYGGDVMRWLDVPVVLLKALYERLTQLAAREDIRLARAVTLGMHILKPEDQRSQWRALEREAGIESSAVRRPATPANLSALGIVVRKAAKKRTA